jgi:hypothetical protein
MRQVREVHEFSRGRRYLTSAALVLTAALTFLVVGALADAPDPVGPSVAPTTATVTQVSNGWKVTVTGGWRWNTRTGDCGADSTRKVGFAVAWFDTTQAGNFVKNFDIGRGTEPISVGAAAANTRNPADNVAHPTPTSTTRFGGAAAGKEVDIEAPAQFAAWRSGCGDPVLAAGTTRPQGVWGPRANKCFGNAGFGTVPCTNQPPPTPPANFSGETGISHIYANRSDIKVLCVVTYDVQGGKKVNVASGGIPAGVGNTDKQTGGHSITAGGANHNDDNDLEKNVGAPFGDACIYFPNITTQVQKGDSAGANFANCASPCVVRPAADSFRDTASLTGAKPGTSVTISFTTYPTLADCNAGTNGTGAGSSAVTTNASGSATATSNILGGASSPAAVGDYFYSVHSSGAAGVSGADSDCNTTNEKVQVARTTPPTETGTKVAITDFARVTGTGVAPTGTVTFTLYDAAFNDPTTCLSPGGNPVTTAFGTPPNTTASTSVNLSTGTGTTARTVHVTTNPLTTTGLNTTATFFWLVEYSGDANYNPSKSCTESVNIAGNVPGVDP